MPTISLSIRLRIATLAIVVTVPRPSSMTGVFFWRAVASSIETGLGPCGACATAPSVLGQHIAAAPARTIPAATASIRNRLPINCRCPGVSPRTPSLAPLPAFPGYPVSLIRSVLILGNIIRLAGAPLRGWQEEKLINHLRQTAAGFHPAGHLGIVSQQS